MIPIIICGAGGHARVVADAVRSVGRYELKGFLVDNFATSGAVMPVLGGLEQLPGLRAAGVTVGFVAIGDAAARLRLAAVLHENGFQIATIIHPRAIVATDVIVHEGAFIAAGAVVNSGTTIERLAIINTNASVDHDCAIGAAVHVCPGVTIAGGVVVDDAAWIGAGATIIDGRRVGAGALIGAGAVVVRDVPAGRKVMGVPAKDKGAAG